MNKLNSACRAPASFPHALPRHAAALAALVATLLAPAGTRAESPPAVQMEKSAYVAMIAADQQRDAGHVATAVAGYTEAARLFRELKSAHPDYNASNVEYRLDYCDRQVGRLPTSTPAPASPGTPSRESTDPAAGVRPNESADTLGSLREEVRRLQAEQAKSQARDKEYADLRDRMARLQSAARELRDRATRNETDLAEARVSAQKDREARDRALADVESLKKASADLLAESAATEQALAEARSALEAERAAAAEKARQSQSSESTEKLKKDLVAAQAESTQRALQLTEAQAALEKSQKTLVETQSALASGNAAAAEAKAQFAQCSEAADKAQKEIQRLIEESQKSRETLKKSESDLEQLRAELAGVRKELEKAVRQVESLTDEKAQQDIVMGGLRDELEQAGRRSGELEKELQSWEERARAAMAESQAWRERQAAADQAAAQAREEASKSAAQVSELEEKIADVTRMVGRMEEEAPAGPAPAVVTEPEPAPEAAAPTAPADIESEHASAREQMRNSDFAGAHARLNELLKQQPENPAILSDAAQCAYRLGLTDDAIEHYKRLLQLQPDHARANFNLAVLYTKTMPPRLDVSRSHYDRARALGEPRDETLERQLDR